MTRKCDREYRNACNSLQGALDTLGECVVQSFPHAMISEINNRRSWAISNRRVEGKANAVR